MQHFPLYNLPKYQAFSVCGDSYRQEALSQAKSFLEKNKKVLFLTINAPFENGYLEDFIFLDLCEKFKGNVLYFDLADLDVEPEKVTIDNLFGAITDYEVVTFFDGGLSINVLEWL
ncbi:hypothetical protein [Pseudoalteromonas piscicida]|uniref:hypothetical protein n=1 Tax=Pseudoalteromonas piscicida TaxID=43662 RepID=UPI0030A386FF